MMFDNEVRARLAKPCPFCGCGMVKTDRPAFFREHKLEATSITCDRCGAQVYGMGSDFNTAYHEALKLWNRRAA